MSVIEALADRPAGKLQSGNPVDRFPGNSAIQGIFR
jgi:hypothetical protein